MARRPRTAADVMASLDWIADEDRQAIYLRDSYTCCYCGQAIIAPAKLSLDHVHPRGLGGADDHTNLVTCCIPCNSDKRNMTFATYLQHLRDWSRPADEVKARVDAALARPLPPKP